MPNEIKYNKVDWSGGTPIDGERLATNGHYTGEHLGTPMQDAIDDSANTPHYVENATIRYGQMTQDAKDSKFPTKIDE